MHVSFTLLISLLFYFRCKVLLFPNKSLTSSHKCLSLTLYLICFLRFWDSLRPSDHHSSDHHTSSKAVYLQCQPLHHSPPASHLAPNRLHQQVPRPATDHSHCARHSPAASPSSRPRGSRMRGKAGPWRPVAHHAEGRNRRPPVSQRIFRWGHLHVCYLRSVKQTSRMCLRCPNTTCPLVFVCTTLLCMWCEFSAVVFFFVPVSVPPASTVPVDENLSSTNERLISHWNRADWKQRIMQCKARQHRLHHT